MSKKPINSTNLEEAIMAKIRADEITMKPRWYFIFGSIAMFVGIVTSTIAAVFLTNIVFFLLRQHGAGGSRRLEVLLSTFPWWILLLAIGGMGLGIWLLKKYDWSYKKNFWLVAGGFIVAIIVAGIAIDQLGLNELWFNRGPMRGFYQRIGAREQNAQPGWSGGNVRRGSIRYGQ